MYPFARTLTLKKRLSALEQFLAFIKGTFLGISFLIPGMGAVTVSLIFGFYDDFIIFLHGIGNIFLQIFKIFYFKFNFKKFKSAIDDVVTDFTIPLFIGIFFGLLIFTFIFRFSLENFPVFLRALFFGLILSSVFVPIKNIKIESIHKVVIIFSMIVFYFLFSLNSSSLFFTPNWVLVILMGVLSAIAFLLPGFGGTLVLLMFNSYRYFVEALYSLIYGQATLSQQINLATLAVTFVITFVLVINLYKKHEKKYLSYFRSLLTGIMIASLRLVYPFIELKGDVITYVKPFDVTYGQSLIVILIILITWLSITFLNKYTNSHDHTL